MSYDDYLLNEFIMTEVIKYASLDMLGYYGFISKSLQFREKCQIEFWNRAIEIENKDELYRKSSKYERRRSVNVMGKKER